MNWGRGAGRQGGGLVTESESGLVFLGHAGQCEEGRRETRKEGGLGQPLVVLTS